MPVQWCLSVVSFLLGWASGYNKGRLGLVWSYHLMPSLGRVIGLRAGTSSGHLPADSILGPGAN